ncbi:hypothetical protein PTSG_02650 [Salpingoeca rosetta]|uniref:DUF4062 domain-containing protein n=1 Tax=Salpingoeca rosetta (strain ATCC 50818 / BSB-021) TaxID=946362 RepID=F2U2X2_SALR5|nr:uncharacterized protein PTSG_02650 [Salpingoeca rosetta]EGD81966.1 hypothetical protein PTSG_02650 [Salpingoeca rosetta]|eukprot:XP_004996149.1 hypothetical protein PTSG_02650 [Salpingoeca rosetta]
MRWGILSEASPAHETTEGWICMREIKRCQQESSGISYVLILGNKYGFRPFPAKIPEEEFKLLKDEMAKQAKQTASTVTSAALNKAMEYMDEWFVLNENVVPPTRELKPVKKEHSDAWWSDIFPTLQTCLRQAATGAPGLSDERRALYVQSVTAEEIDNGLFKVQPKEARDKACFVFDRRLEGIDVASDPDTAKLFIDMTNGEVDEEAQQLLERSRAEAVPAALSPSRIKTMSIPWGPGIDLARGALLALARGMFGITVVRADTLEAMHRIQAPANRIMAATPSGDLLACSDLQQPFVAVYSLEQVDVHAKALTDREYQQQSLISEPHVAMLAADGASGAGETLPAFAVGRDDLGFYDAATMALVHTVALKEHRASALNVKAVSSDGWFIIVWSMAQPFLVLDAVQRKMYKDVITFREIKNTVLCTTTSDDGGDGAAVLATCDGNTIVKLWRLQQEEHPYASIKVHSGYASSVSLVWLPKQQLLASCAQEQHLLLWNLAGELVRATNLKPAWAFLKYVVAEAYGGLQFLDASTLEPVFRAYGHDFGLEINTRNKRVRMTPDGRFFVSWAMDDAILVHDFSHLTL